MTCIHTPEVLKVFVLIRIQYREFSNPYFGATVVLGIIDPTDGDWHSMWDIGLPPLPGPDLETHMMPDMKLIGSNLPAFNGDNEFDGSIIDYVNHLSGGSQKTLTQLQKYTWSDLPRAAEYIPRPSALAIS